MSDDIHGESDFGKIIWLLCNDVPLTGAESVGPTRVEFQFQGREHCEELIRKMMFEDKVSLQRMLTEIRKARAIISDVKG